MARAEVTYDTPLLEKLGIRPGTAVALVHGSRAFAAEVRTAGALVRRSPADAEVTLLFAADLGDLASLPTVTGAAALWIVYPKGRKDITENDVLAAGRAAALTDTKVARFSDTHTALKFVVPRSRRG